MRTRFIPFRRTSMIHLAYPLEFRNEPKVSGAMHVETHKKKKAFTGLFRNQLLSPNKMPDLFRQKFCDPVMFGMASYGVTEVGFQPSAARLSNSA